MIPEVHKSIIVLALLLSPAAAQTRFEGESMGTTWQVTVTGEADQNLKSVIQRELDLVDTLMSTWRDDSEISRFNASDKTDWFPVSEQTAAVAVSYTHLTLPTILLV